MAMCKGLPLPLPFIPEDLVIDNILTRLPAKSLFGFTSVSKNWHRVISSDSKFAINQSCNINSSSSSSSSTPTAKGIIFVDHDGESIMCLSLPSVGSPHHNSPIGIPDPTLHFLSLDRNSKLTISASTNGLLCFKNRSFLHVCNPVTKEAHQIPCCIGTDSVGLAFNPITSPHHYKLVHPVRNFTDIINNKKYVEYGFEVFSSNNAHELWVRSSQRVALPQSRKNSKSVFAKGILYWHCQEYLLWFDCTEKGDAAGYISMPPQERYVMAEIGVREDHVTCSQVTREGLEVWELVHDTSTNVDGKWEMKHHMSLDKMLQERLAIRMSERTRKRKRNSDGSKDEDDSDRVLKKLWMCPLPYEGGETVYLRVMMRPTSKEPQSMYCKQWHKLVCFDLKTRNASEECFHGKVLCGYVETVFGYDNNLVPLPNLCL